MNAKQQVERQMTNFHKVLFYLADTLTDITKDEDIDIEINMNLKQIQSESGELRWYASHSVQDKAIEPPDNEHDPSVDIEPELKAFDEPPFYDIPIKEAP